MDFIKVSSPIPVDAPVGYIVFSDIFTPTIGGGGKYPLSWKTTPPPIQCNFVSVFNVV